MAVIEDSLIDRNVFEIILLIFRQHILLPKTLLLCKKKKRERETYVYLE